MLGVAVRGSPANTARRNSSGATTLPLHKVIAPEGKLLSLLQAYQQSQDFLSKRPRTRTDYIKQIAKIEQKFGNAPIKALADPRTRGIFLE
jgi:hypothetical protein